MFVGPKLNTLKNSKNHVFDSRSMRIDSLQKLLCINKHINISIILTQIFLWNCIEVVEGKTYAYFGNFRLIF